MQHATNYHQHPMQSLVMRGWAHALTSTTHPHSQGLIDTASMGSRGLASFDTRANAGEARAPMTLPDPDLQTPAQSSG